MALSSNETGRSMIEMLGVLAIIGVLSVGGIAGYSKAMMKFKINKTVDQISQIVGNIRTLYSTQKTYAGLDSWEESGKKIIKKSHLVPDEMWDTAGTSLENAFGGSVGISVSGKKDGTDNKAFAIELNSLPEEACMELSTYDWGSGSSSGLIALNINDASARVFNYYAGCNGDNKTACPQGSTSSVPMSVSIAADACASGDNNHIALKFY